MWYEWPYKGNKDVDSNDVSPIFFLLQLTGHGSGQ